MANDDLFIFILSWGYHLDYLIYSSSITNKRSMDFLYPDWI